MTPSFFTSLLLLSLMSFFQFSSTQPLCREFERLALMQFKNSFFIDKNATRNPMAYPKVELWKSQGSDCCSWEGITCSQHTGHVVGIELNSTCLFGSINSSSSLFNLGHLRYLNLADNHFNYSSIPPAFGNLSRLISLDLSYSSFSGQVPFEISKLSKLTKLDMSWNVDFSNQGWLQLKTPHWKSLIQNLTQLEYLSLSSVNINSSVTHALANFSSLTFLNLKGCGLFGEFPNAIFQLPKLEILSVCDNSGLAGIFPEFHFNNPLKELEVSDTNFSGEIPKSLGLLSSLEYLTVANCNFSGIFSPSLSNLTKLRTINLRNNSFEGSMVSFFPNLTQLEYVDLSFNLFTFSEVPSLARSTNLFNLDLSFNFLKGSLPIPSPSMFTYKVADNSFDGEIPPDFCNITSLELLDLSQNNLSGIIPQCLGNDNRSLTNLKLGQNNLQGKLPRSLANCKDLEYLDLSNNQIRDAFPSWLGVLPRLKIIILRSNRFYGAINDSGSESLFPELRIIDLSHNEFVGSLPLKYFQQWNVIANHDEEKATYLMGEISSVLDGEVLRYGVDAYYSVTITNKGNQMEYGKILEIFTAIDLSFLRKLKLLNLSNNVLVGPIPSALGNLSNLEALDLSNGRIPTELTHLNFLEVFDVSNNLLTGSILHGSQFDTFENSSFEGNPGLCGMPLSKKCGNHAPPLPSSSEENGHISLLSKISWRAVLIGCGCGFLGGVVLGVKVFARHQEWLMETFRIKQGRRSGNQRRMRC